MLSVRQAGLIALSLSPAVGLHPAGRPASADPGLLPSEAERKYTDAGALLQLRLGQWKRPEHLAFPLPADPVSAPRSSPRSAGFAPRPSPTARGHRLATYQQIPRQGAAGRL